jgi:glycosyltransferase involved in cell wall biosynthesis
MDSVDQGADQRPTMISIGVLAHNEAGVVDRMLAGLARQTIFTRADFDVRLHVVPNGCTDDTAERARGVVGRPDIQATIRNAYVHEIERKGKGNAWNALIHDFVDPATSLMLMIDADISFPEDNSCELVVNRLIEQPDVVVAIDRVVSDLSLVAEPGIIDRLLLAATGTEHDSAISITGHFYCGRFDVLRTIRMPSEIIGEDGFLRAMTLTTNLTTDEDLSRLSMVREARHVYKSERNLSSIFRHQVRQTVGTIMNIVLFGHLRAMLVSEPDLGTYVQRRNAQDPTWLHDLVARDWPGNDGARRRFLLRRFSGSFGVMKTPFRAALALVDLVTYAVAMRKIRKRRLVGFW